MERKARIGEPKFPARQSGIFAALLERLNGMNIPFCAGGAIALHTYTGIWRNTKDLDLFVTAEDVHRILDSLQSAGFETEIRDTWLAKAWRDNYYVDFILSIGNRRVRVERSWMERSLAVDVCGVQVPIIPLEEMITSKVFMARRSRFDGPDVLHLIRMNKGRIDWQRLLKLLGQRRRILLWHLVLFQFVYPGHPDCLPQELMTELFEEMRLEWSNPPPANAFRGMLLDDVSFAVDVEDWDYQDLQDSTSE